jgi:hypothetical protein
MDQVAAALDSAVPLPLLTLASAVLSALEPRRQWPPSPDPEPELPRDEVLDVFFRSPAVETSALLTALGALTGDEVLGRRVRREVALRGDVLPRWLTQLDRAVPAGRPVLMTEVLGDGEDIVLGVELTGGSELVVLVFVDHESGSLVKDAFVTVGPVADVVATMRSRADDDFAFADLSPADARARIREAIDRWAITVPVVETDTWPSCRPLLEWVLRALPEGGTGYERREWSDEERQEIADRFFASGFGSGFDDDDHRRLLDTLLWYGTDYGPGDPLRWSPVRVEILLADWIPRKIRADVPYLAKAPDLLRAFIRFAHDEAEIRPGLTDETLAMVDELEPEYQEIIRTPRLQGPEALLARMGALDEDLLEHRALAELALEVGGEDVLAALDDAPLPDEPFAWVRVPDDVRERVGEVLALVDRACDELFDVEVRTASRRLLAAVVAGDAEIFRGRTQPKTLAATIVWLVAQANKAFSNAVTVAGLLAHIGVGSGTPGRHADRVLRAIGVVGYGHGPLRLESVDYLTSEGRRQVIRLRDAFADR